jgi:PBSX family phage terminase large subunit
MQEILSKKQIHYIINSTKKWNMAHGSVRTGKTIGATHAFMYDVEKCPDSQIYIVGHTFDTAYRNIVRLITSDPSFSMYHNVVTWSGKKLYYKDKQITVLGAKDEGAIGSFQGDTYSLVYCDEITLYPQSIIEMINSRLSKPYSKAHCTMNPTYPEHLIKQWIDKAEKGDNNYYALHFTLEDNPFVDENYKNMLKNSSTGIFYKRNYLGLWCLAEGAIFECFDRNIHVLNRPPRAAEYWIVGVDYGASNPFACVLVGVNTGIKEQIGKSLWVEDEIYWDHKNKRQKTNSELADDLCKFIENYAVKAIYIDPSAAAFKTEMRRRNVPIIDADNDVFNGLDYTVSEMRKGNLFVLENCKNTIKELESYVWDSNKAKRGEDAPLKQNDHLADALRYCIYTHKVPTYQPYKDPSNANQYQQNRFQTGKRQSIF